MSGPGTGVALPDDAGILAGVAEVARRHLGWQGEMRRELPIVEALELDSLRLLTLVVEIENHFRVMLDEGSEQGIETVGDLVDVIRSKLDPSLDDAE